MSKNIDDVKPYLKKIKNWKIRNMIMLYLEARGKFKDCNKLMKTDKAISFERMREINDILYEIKEAYHLLYRRLLDPHKKKFENTMKFTPNQIEIEFMNNIGLLFHKIMVARELKYVMEHYVQEDEAFQKNEENLLTNLARIDELFDEGIDILKALIRQNTDNVLLLTLLLENAENTKKHFGNNAVKIIEQFSNGNGLDEVYYHVGKYYADCGWKNKAKKMLQSAVKRNKDNVKAQEVLATLN